MEVIDIRRNLLTVGSFVNKINKKIKYDIRSCSSLMSRELWVAQSNITFPHNLSHQILSPHSFQFYNNLKLWLDHTFYQRYYNIQNLNIWIWIEFEVSNRLFFSSSCSANFSSSNPPKFQGSWRTYFLPKCFLSARWLVEEDCQVKGVIQTFSNTNTFRLHFLHLENEANLCWETRRV